MMINPTPMLTTADNPHDPFEQWDDWFAFDAKHHDTPGLLARVAVLSPDLSTADQELALLVAMQEIVDMHAGGIYKIVFKDTETSD